MTQNNASKIDVPYVVNLSSMRNYLDKFDDGTRLTKDEMENIYHILLSSAVDISNGKHVKNIHQTQNELKKGICPRCGEKLVLRQGKYGSFYGCSQYPRCKFVLNEKEKMKL